MGKKMQVQEKDMSPKKVLSFIVDLIAAILLVSVINFFVVSVFGFSEMSLMKEGIQTSLLERKLEIYDFVSLGYFFIIIAYLIFGRKYFSIGDKLLDNQK